MSGSVLRWIVVIGGSTLVFLVIQVVYLSLVLAWEDQKTRGLGYYGLSPDDRAAFKRTLRRHARLLYPILRLISRTTPFTFEKATFRANGLPGPRGTCSEESFARAFTYEPTERDVFVVTQMKCGTTWMQYLVYEVLERGAGDLVESGRTLYAVSGWLEALKSVSVEDSPLIGRARPSRIIKTHLPKRHCPWSPAAKYIYVARHPVSCLASCRDFLATNAGALAPPLPVVEEWFCSENAMWWGPWPDHVRGWWEAATGGDNVLFVYFEEMKRDLRSIVNQVAAFLEVEPLSAEELDRIVTRTSFAWMQEHKDAFEMHPPHLLATDARLFVRGSADRHRDLPDEVRRRVSRWCARRLADTAFPLAKAWPDVAVDPPTS